MFLLMLMFVLDIVKEGKGRNYQLEQGLIVH